MDVFTELSSKIHGARIYKLSPISKKLKNICEDQYHIFGDAAYSLREWLLVPYKDYGNMSEVKKHYNSKFVRTRVIIENAFGVLKSRFLRLQCLYFMDVDKISQFIIACCVVRNLCIVQKDDIVESDFEPLRISQNVPENDATEREELLSGLGEVKLTPIARILNNN